MWFRSLKTKEGNRKNKLQVIFRYMVLILTPRLDDDDDDDCDDVQTPWTAERLTASGAQ